jgi:hypothetical protein
VSEDTALLIVVAAAVCVILGIVVRALWAEWKKRPRATNEDRD